MNYLVRTAQLKDLADLVDVLSNSFHASTGIMRWFSPILRLGVYEDLRQRLRSPDGDNYICLVAVSLVADNCLATAPVVGTVEVTLKPTFPLQVCSSTPYPYLSNLAVKLDCRRQGIAQRLLEASEKAVKDWGCRDLYLHVLEDNYQARRLYSKAGYKVKQTDPLWRSLIFRQPRRLLLHKTLTSFSTS